MKYLLIVLTFITGLAAMGAHAQSGQSARGQIGGVAAPAATEANVPAAATVPAKGGESDNMGLMIGAGIAVVAGVLVLVFVRSRREEGNDGDTLAYEGGYETIDPNVRPRKEPVIKSADASMSTRPRTDTIIAPWSVPADFDVPRFLRKAKAYFMRLQASWDKGDVRDIRQFTTREIFGEFCLQLNVRKELHNATEVVTLGAELLGVDTVDEAYVATVKFTGMIKDAPEAQVAPFSEVWTMSKPTNGTRSWAITAIQQY